MSARVQSANRFGTEQVELVARSAVARSRLAVRCRQPSPSDKNCRGSLMNSTRSLVANQASVLILAAAVFFTTGLSASAQNVQHLSITQPGGMPGLPVMTGIQRVTNGVTVTWDGPSGYYQVLQKVNLNDSKWVNWGKATNLVRRATITTITSNSFFRVFGPSPQYAGSQACAVCHQNIHDTETTTPHAGAFTNAQFVAE